MLKWRITGRESKVTPKVMIMMMMKMIAEKEEEEQETTARKMT